MMTRRYHITSIRTIQCMWMEISEVKISSLAHLRTDIQLYLVGMVITALCGGCPCCYLVLIEPCLYGFYVRSVC